MNACKSAWVRGIASEKCFHIGKKEICKKLWYTFTESNIVFRMYDLFCSCFISMPLIISGKMAYKHALMAHSVLRGMQLNLQPMKCFPERLKLHPLGVYWPVWCGCALSWKLPAVSQTPRHVPPWLPVSENNTMRLAVYRKSNCACFSKSPIMVSEVSINAATNMLTGFCFVIMIY